VTAKEFLDKHGIQYQEFDISKDAAARKEIVSLTGQLAVPQIYIDGEVILGFNEELLRNKLGIKE
jgi:glutaredoxin 3